MTLGQDILKELVLNLKCSEHVVEADDGPFKGSTTSMFDFDTCMFKDLNTGKITPIYSAEKRCVGLTRCLIV